MKDKLRTSSFWLGIGGAVIIIIDCISGIFNINIASAIVENIVITICSVLVMFGIITKKNVTDVEVSTKDELMIEVESFNSDNDDLN